MLDPRFKNCPGGTNGDRYPDIQQKYDDAPLDLDPALVSGSYIPHFKAPAERNPTYQGEYQQY